MSNLVYVKTFRFTWDVQHMSDIYVHFVVYCFYDIMGPTLTIYTPYVLCPILIMFFSIDHLRNFSSLVLKQMCSFIFGDKKVQSEPK